MVKFATMPRLPIHVAALDHFGGALQQIQAADCHTAPILQSKILLIFNEEAQVGVLGRLVLLRNFAIQCHTVSRSRFKGRMERGHDRRRNRSYFLIFGQIEHS